MHFLFRLDLLPPSSIVRRTEEEPRDQGRYVEPATSQPRRWFPTYARQPRRFDSRQQQLRYFFSRQNLSQQFAP